MYNRYWIEKAGCLRSLYDPAFANLPFSPSLYNRLVETTRNATKPIIFLYGKDDTWTGAAVKDEFVNGTNVQKHILPDQHHLVQFSASQTTQDYSPVITALDAVLSGSPQGNPSPTLPRREGVKMLRDGVLYLMYNGTMYNITGVKLR